MRPKYLLGGSLLIMAVSIVIVQGFSSNFQYYLTVSQLREKAPEFQSHNVRISGAVIGDSIAFDAQALYLEFDIVDSVEQIGAQPPLRIVYEGPRPELLQDHAQAVIEGRLNADGAFYADTLLLKCPTRYEEQFPQQAQGN